jgi:hypothetical protein
MKNPPVEPARVPFFWGVRGSGCDCQERRMVGHHKRNDPGAKAAGHPFRRPRMAVDSRSGYPH